MPAGETSAHKAFLGGGKIYGMTEDLARKQAQAEIRLANARARAFERGDSLITINGDGLQPHLEAFMFEILEAIQVRVSADGLEFLLGAN